MGAKRFAVVVLLVMLGSACSNAEGDDTGGLPPLRASTAPSASPGAPASELAASEAPVDAELIADAYREYTAAVSRALAAGDTSGSGLSAVATGQALKNARARVRANRSNGVVTTGELEPSVTAAEVEWSGGDTATLSDCVLNGLALVRAEQPDTVEAEATGTRRPVDARLIRTGDGWKVSRVAMPQDEDSDNPQRDRPFLRGPMPDGPPSCAPPALEQELIRRYLAFWDAFDRAFGFGRDGPADPDDPALAETSVDPQLSDAREFFTDMLNERKTSRGERNERNPVVLGVTDFDRSAFLADCVRLGDSVTVDVGTGDVVERNATGEINYYEGHMVVRNKDWMVKGVELLAEGLSECAGLVEF